MISCSKTNLGHLEGGAGMSAFCKCVLACMHAEVAPNQHLRVQNPNMDTEGRYSVPTPCPPLCSSAWENAIEGWPALLLQEGQALKGEASYVRASDLLCRPLRPRRGFQVGVSGFGYGGTNSHAMAFGKNVVTSRGGRAKNSADALIRQVRSAPPEIAMVGDNFEDWQSNGVPHLSMKPGQSFQVDVMEGGRTFWSAVPSSKPRSVKSLSIQGSFNGWTAESMVARETRVGLYEFELSLGASGSESFQVLVDGLTSQVLHPAEPHCTSRVAPVRGPRHDAGRELAWMIQRGPRDRFLIEVFLPPGEVQSMSVTWFKLRDIAPLPPLQTPPAPAPQPMVLDELGIEE
ncbi:ppsA [Symbiodinium necroappetens]|uniref:PpsA protein n=1 Tax=Symbiodinium necroappetens TaxID=1628268 RepID=A0A812S420_9DINO|nr:ppsA [Symbiodinium necroappetens]